MVNGLAVLGWGVGGIEAEAAMLGQPISMLIPEVVGFRLTGKLREGATATDLVLTVTQMLRKKGVVGRFVEFFGPGVAELALADRATIGNMAPEYGATCGFFPIDAETHPLSDASPAATRRGSSWSRPMPRRRACGTTSTRPIRSSPTRSSSISPPSSRRSPGPRRPQDRVALSGVRQVLRRRAAEARRRPRRRRKTARCRSRAANYELDDGDVVIAAITSPAPTPRTRA